MELNETEELRMIAKSLAGEGQQILVPLTRIGKLRVLKAKIKFKMFT